MADGEVKILGMRELIKAVDEINRDFPKEMGDAASEVARTVVRGAQGNTGTAQQAFVARSLSYGSDGEAGTVQADHPAFPGAEFGGGGRPSTMQFPPHRGQRGYFLYPWMRANASRLDDIWQEGIETAMKPWNYKPRNS